MIGLMRSARGNSTGEGVANNLAKLAAQGVRIRVE